MTRTSTLCRIGALVVTTAAASGLASTSAASADGVRVQAALPPASAGWHGRAILRPEAGKRRVSLPVVTAVAPSPRRVREVQHTLKRLGYRPGPVDGVLGPRTRAALQWFQIKHALAASGAVNRPTVALLNRRAADRGTSAVTASTAHAPVPVAGTGRRNAPMVPAATSAAPSGAGDSSSGRSGFPPILGVVLALAALMLLIAKVRRRPPADGAQRHAAVSLPGADPRPGALAALMPLIAKARRRPPADGAQRPAAVSLPGADPRPGALAALMPLIAKVRRRPPANGAQRPAADPHPGADRRPHPDQGATLAGPRHALGYAAGRNAAEIERAAQAIRQTCSNRGWELAQLVRDGGAAAEASRRAGLAYALDRIADERIPRLVVGRLEHAARTPGELAALLRWSARHDADIVADDVGLDTSTPEGRMTARCLLAVGATRAPAAAPRRNGNGRHVPQGRG